MKRLIYALFICLLAACTNGHQEKNESKKDLQFPETIEVSGIKFIVYKNEKGDIDMVVGSDSSDNVIFAKSKAPGGLSRECIDCWATHSGCKRLCDNPLDGPAPGCFDRCDANRKNCESANGCNLIVGTGKGNIY